MAVINKNNIYKAIEDGKSMDRIVGMFVNKKTTNTDEIMKIVRDYKWNKWRRSLNHGGK